MRITRFLMGAVAVLSLSALAQCASDSQEPGPQVLITNLSPPVYPPLALQARITGTVELNITIASTGNVESIEVVNGHPLLTKAAVDSVHLTQFQCRECEASMRHLMTYNFELEEAVYCADVNCEAQCPKSPPRVTQSQNTITIVDRPVATCDPVGTIVRVRSAKCFFLWRCGKRYPL